MKRSFLTVLISLCVLLLSSQALALASYRGGSLTWTVPDPVGAPLTVKFTVTATFDPSGGQTTTLVNFGDGVTNPATTGTVIGTGVDTLGNSYTTFRYTANHTYASAGVFNASFNDCCRPPGVVNGALSSYRMQSMVSLAGGNTAGPVLHTPTILQLQTGATRTVVFPVGDQDGDAVTCRFSTNTESTLPAGALVPAVSPGGPQAVLSNVAGGCQMVWNVTNPVPGSKIFVFHIVVESTRGGVTSSSAKELFVDLVNAPPPTCAGTGTFVANVGQPFAATVTGTEAAAANMTMTTLGLPVGATTNPASGTNAASPFSATINWTPAVSDGGTTQTVAFSFTNAAALSGTCFVTVQVNACAAFGQACTVGVGQCAASGTLSCNAPNVTVCSATAGTPVAELCDGLDNDCDGTVDNGNPGGGAACSTGLAGLCAAGTTACVSGGLVCNGTVTPGSVAEVCGNLTDEDCDGVLDNSCLDTDGDGIPDFIETTIGTDPFDADSDDDGVLDGDEPNYDEDSDGDGLINALDPDSDNDGLFDGTELGLDCNGAATNLAAGHCIPDGDAGATTTDPLDADTDDGGATDGSEDVNLNGVVDAGETDPTAGNGADDGQNLDSDGDGLSDGLEATLGSDPFDADTDDDGVLDGLEANPSDDTDGDGHINVLDPDSDDDGLFDGTEMGFDCSDPATNAALGHCIADGDAGATVTSPLDADTDDGGVNDGSEDHNLNGVVDVGETDPTAGNGADDGLNADSDGDGLSDLLEVFLGSDPADADTDNDGVIDGDEPNPSDDFDGDGLSNVLDSDSDGDGLFDGTELGLDCLNPATDNLAMQCIADGDQGATVTDMLDADTDDGGALDGQEDANHNGVLDAGETDPTAGHGDDDAQSLDSDGDGLSDAAEVLIGTDPFDADSDDDGVIDGLEINPGEDFDNDGLINALDPDSDNDGLFDGTEMGFDCSDSATDPAAGTCIPDGDAGATTTDPLDADTDDGSVSDGDEDENHNGVVDPGETDPNDGSDDVPSVGCASDSECGGETSGMVCDDATMICVEGCRGDGVGNRCGAGFECTSVDSSIGQCIEAPECATDAECGSATSGLICDGGICVDGCRGVGNGCPSGETCSSTTEAAGICAAPEAAVTDDVFAEGNGILCSTRPAGDDGRGTYWALSLVIGAAVASRRRKSREERS